MKWQSNIAKRRIKQCEAKARVDALRLPCFGFEDGCQCAGVIINGNRINLCSNSDRPANIATRRSRRIRSRRASAAMNAPFAQRASKTSCAMSAQIAAADLRLARSDLRGTGRMATFLGKTRQAARSSTGLSIPLSTLSSYPRSGTFRPRSGRIRRQGCRRSGGAFPPPSPHRETGITGTSPLNGWYSC